MIIWILVSFVLKMADVWCMPDVDEPVPVTKDLPELDQIDNFLESIQKRLQDGNTVIKEFRQYNNYSDEETTPGIHGHDNDTQNGVLNDKSFTKAFGEFLHLLVTKHAEDVTAVVKHSKEIIDNMIADDRLAWLTEPLRKVVINIVIGLSDLPLLQTRAALIEFFHEIKNRKEEYRPKVNELFDKANAMVDEKHERDLNKVLNNFKEYHRDSTYGEKLCRDIIEAFQGPFAEHEGTPELVELMNESNTALKERFKVISRKARRSDGDEASFDRVKKRLAVLTHVEKFLDQLQVDVEDGQTKLQNIYKENASNESLYIIDNETSVMPELTYTTDGVDNPSAFSQDIRDMGYFTFVIQKLWSLFVLKKQKDVGEVLKHIKSIVNKKSEDGNLDWLGTSLKQMVVDTGNAFNNLPSSMIIHSALGFYKDLNNRETVYSPEVNKIMDKADEIYTEQDTLNVLKAIRHFEEYPKESDKTAREICEDVIDALLEPFKKNPEGVVELNTLLESANQILNNDSRFKLVFFKSDNYRRSYSNSYYNGRPKKKMYAISRKPLEDLHIITHVTCPTFSQSYNNHLRPYLGYRPRKSRPHISRQGLSHNTLKQLKLFAKFSKPYRRFSSPKSFMVTDPRYNRYPESSSRFGMKNNLRMAYNKFRRL